MGWSLLEIRAESFEKSRNNGGPHYISAGAEFQGRSMMEPTMRVRPATPVDSAAIADIYNQGIEDRTATNHIKECTIFATTDQHPPHLGGGPRIAPASAVASLDTSRLEFGVDGSGSSITIGMMGGGKLSRQCGIDRR
jgi:hypothetical protein